MKVEVFCLCEQATVKNRKLYIEGTFDRRVVPMFPCQVPGFCIPMQWRFQPSENGKHEIAVAIQTDKGRPLGPNYQQTIEVKMPPKAPSYMAFIILKIGAMKIPGPGNLVFNLLVDGQQAHSIPYYLRQSMQRTSGTSTASSPPQT